MQNVPQKHCSSVKYAKVIKTMQKHENYIKHE